MMPVLKLIVHDKSSEPYKNSVIFKKTCSNKNGFMHSRH